MSGNSSSARSARVKRQLRDRNGRWIEMGGLVKYSQGSDVFTGKVVEIDPDSFDVDEMVIVKVNTPGNKYFGEEVAVATKYIEAIDEKATLDLTPTKSEPVTSKPTDSIDYDDDYNPSSYRDEEYDEDRADREADRIADQKNSIGSKPKRDPYSKEIVEPYTVKEAAFKNFPGYTEGEMLALAEYANEFSGINEPLRRGDKYAKVGLIYDSLMSMIDKSPLAEPTTVYRALNANADLLSKMKVNSIYYDRAFSSTSSARAGADNRLDEISSYDVKKVKGQIKKIRKPNKNGVILIMELPAGFKAHKFDYDIGNKGIISRFHDEQEVLLPPETAFRVKSMTEKTDGTGWEAVIEPILTKNNSIGVGTADAEATQVVNDATAPAPVPEKKKWWQYSISAEELTVGSKLVSDNGIVLEKVSDQTWEYTSASNRISYNNNSIDAFKSIDAVEFNVETS